MSDADWSKHVLASIASPQQPGQQHSDKSTPVSTSVHTREDDLIDAESSQLGNDKFETSPNLGPCKVAPDELARDIGAWLRTLGLDEHRLTVLKWCEESGVGTFIELPDFTSQFAELLGLEPEVALCLRNHARHAFEAVLASKLATADFSPEAMMAFCDDLADSLGLDREEALGLWMRTSNVLAAMHETHCIKRKVDFSSEEPVDFFEVLAEGLHLNRAQAQFFWSKVCRAFLEEDRKQAHTGRSKKNASGVSLRPTTNRTGLHARQPVAIKHNTHSCSSRFLESSRSMSRPRLVGELDSRPSLLSSPAARNRPAWDASSSEENKMKHPSKQNYFDSIHRQPQFSLMHFRKASQPVVERARRRKRPEWNTSWNDNYGIHSSQQKYFDSLHNVSQYSLMHFRKSSPNTVPEQQWWGAESKWWSTEYESSSTTSAPESRSPSRHRGSSTSASPQSPPSSPTLPRVGSQGSIQNRATHDLRHKVPSHGKSTQNMQSKGRQQHLHSGIGFGLSVQPDSERGHRINHSFSHGELYRTTMIEEPRAAWMP